MDGSIARLLACLLDCLLDDDLIEWALHSFWAELGVSGSHRTSEGSLHCIVLRLEIITR
jgi:hypothetical protein